MSVQTLLFLILLLQVALIVILYRKERHLLDALNRAQTQNARWLSDVKEQLRREIRDQRPLSAARRETSEADRYRGSDERDRDRRWEGRSED